MAGPLSLGAKILGGLDQAGSKNLLPEPIYRHARRQGILPRHEPAGKTEAILGCIFGQRRHESRGISWTRFAFLVIFATLEDIGRPRLTQLFRSQASRH